jgi:membrane-associated phospholipid phosphatase
MYTIRKTGLHLFAALILSGCAARRYQPVPIVPTETASRLETRSLGDEGFHAFVQKNLGHSVTPWPPKTWNLSTLSLAALYLNPSLEAAKARVEEAQAAIVTAGARPNPSLSITPGLPSPYLFNLDFSVPIETSGKCGHRIQAARSLDQAARFDLADSARKVRSGVRIALLNYLLASRSLDLVRSDEQALEAQSISATSSSSDQTSEEQHQPSTQPAICGVTHLGQCLKDIGHDQAGIWTSPLRIQPRDAFWLVPFAAGTGVALHYDAQAQQNLGVDKSRIDASNTISGFGSPYATLGGAAGLYFLGLGTHNQHLAETARLGAEAVIDSLLVVEALKLATNRERPNEGNGQGGFWPHGTRSYEIDGSFPSGHAAESFALARVLASEYSSKPVQIAAYAFALAISASRVTARQHFPSDALVGGTFGYLIGGYVVRHHAAGNDESTLFIAPIMEQSTRTFGLRVDVVPSEQDLTKIGKLIGRLHGAK